MALLHFPWVYCGKVSLEGEIASIIPIQVNFTPVMKIGQRP